MTPPVGQHRVCLGGSRSVGHFDHGGRLHPIGVLGRELVLDGGGDEDVDVEGKQLLVGHDVAPGVVAHRGVPVDGHVLPLSLLCDQGGDVEAIPAVDPAPGVADATTR